MLTQALLFLLDSVGGFIGGVLVLRFLMQVFRVSFSNPLGALVVQLSNWIVAPLRRVLPGFMGFDLASLLPAYAVQVLLLLARVALLGGMHIGIGAPEMLAAFIAGQAVLATLRLGVYLMIGALVLQAVLSWINPYSPFSQPVHQFTRPLLAPLQRIIPPLGMIDLSPLVAILLLQLILIFL